MGGLQPLIAVVDDEASVRTMLGRVLRLANYRVSAFASGEALLASLSYQPPACVVLDVHMPALDGLQVQEELRLRNVNVPVVFITGSDDPSLELTARAAGSVLLRKPFASDDLLAAIERALSRGSH